MTFQGALLKEQGITFMIVIVKKYVVDNRTEAGETVQTFQSQLGVPVILMAQDSQGIPTYYGRADIVKFLANVHPLAIPWHEYDLN